MRLAFLAYGRHIYFDELRELRRVLYLAPRQFHISATDMRHDGARRDRARLGDRRCSIGRGIGFIECMSTIRSSSPMTSSRISFTGRFRTHFPHETFIARVDEILSHLQRSRSRKSMPQSTSYADMRSTSRILSSWRHEHSRFGGDIATKMPE